MRITLDSSMSLTWCLSNQANQVSKSVLYQVKLEGVLVPAVWHLEMANILGLKLRDGNLSRADLGEALSLLHLLDIVTDNSISSWNITNYLECIERFHLAAYDALYLELALRTGSPLATFDKAMIASAQRHGVPLLGSF